MLGSLFFFFNFLSNSLSKQKVLIRATQKFYKTAFTIGILFTSFCFTIFLL